MANTVNILVQAKDQASDVLKRFGKNAKASLDDANSSLNRMSGTLKSIRLPLAAAGAGITGFGVLAVKNASDMEESLNKVGEVFKDNRSNVVDFASTAASSMGVSKNAALEYAGTLGTILNATGATSEESADMSTTLVQLAADMGSFNNASIEETLNAIRSGLVGEVEPLRRYGVLLSQAAVEQEAVRIGLSETGKDLTEQQKVQARYSILLAQTTTQQGDFARTSDSLANKVKTAKAQFSDLSGELGVQLLPAATKLVGVLSKIVGWFAGLDENTKTVIIAVAGVTAGMIALGLAIPPIIGLFTALGVASNVALAGIPIIVAAVTAGAVLLIKNWQKVVDFFKGAGGWILAAFGPIGLAAKLVIDHWDSVVDAVRNAVNFIVDAINKIIDGLNYLARAADSVAGIWGGSVTEIKRLNFEWEESTKRVTDAYNFMGNAVEENAGAVDAAVTATAVSVQGAGLDMVRSNMAVVRSFQAVAVAAGGGGQGLGIGPSGTLDLFPGVGTATRAYLDQYFETGRTPQAGFFREFANPGGRWPGAGDSADISGPIVVEIDGRAVGATIADDFYQGGGF